MTVETTSVFAGPYTTDGVATAFPFSFKALTASEVRVEVDAVVVSPAAYVVQIAAQSGTVTFTLPPAAGGALYVISDPDFRQGISFSNQAAFLPTSHNEANDRAAVRDQVLAERSARSLKLSLGEVSPNLPSAFDRANSVIAFDETGNVVTKPFGSFPPGPPGQGLPDLMGPGGSALVGSKAAGTGAVNSTVAASVAALGITAADFGITFSGADESAKLQAAINAGHQYQKPIMLHGNLLGIGSALDLKGRYVDIRGSGASSTALVATAVMDRMLDIEEASDVIVSPFFLSGLRIECNHKAAKGIVVRYRHFTEMSGLYVLNATAAAIEEKDAWNNIRRNVVTHGSPIGLSLVGANHNSQWDKCSFATNTGVQLKIDNQGTANDGNMGLLFNACDVEFGSGKGITQASGCSSLFNACYIGENIDLPIIENAGHMIIHGGVAFWGYTTNSYLVRPLGGRTIFDGVQLNGQTNGVPNMLVNLSNAETDAGTYGKTSFRNSVTYCAPQPAFYNGDVLAPILGHTYAPRYGQDFTAYGNGDTVVASSSSGSSKTMTITTPGASALAAMRCDLAGGWQKGQRIFYALTYQSSKPVRIKLAQSAFGANQFIFDAPATTRISTVVILSVTPDIATYPFIELQPLAISAGDTMTVHKQAFGDASFLNAGDSAFGNFGMIG